MNPGTYVLHTGAATLEDNTPLVHMADSIPPGQVELVAEGDDCGAWETLSVQKDMHIQMVCVPLRPLAVNWTLKGKTGRLCPGIH